MTREPRIVYIDIIIIIFFIGSAATYCTSMRLYTYDILYALSRVLHVLLFNRLVVYIPIIRGVYKRACRVILFIL